MRCAARRGHVSVMEPAMPAVPVGTGMIAMHSMTVPRRRVTRVPPCMAVLATFVAVTPAPAPPLSAVAPLAALAARAVALPLGVIPVTVTAAVLAPLRTPFVLAFPGQQGHHAHPGLDGWFDVRPRPVRGGAGGGRDGGEDRQPEG